VYLNLLQLMVVGRCCLYSFVLSFFVHLGLSVRFIKVLAFGFTLRLCLHGHDVTDMRSNVSHLIFLRTE